MFYN
jgi:hypothetical protein